MNTKNYLSKVLVYRELAERYERKIETIRAEIESVKGVSFDSINVQSSPTDDAMTNYVAELINLESKYQKAKAKYLRAYDEISHLIYCVESPLHQRILICKYLEGMTLAKVASKLQYSEEYIRNEHAKAIKLIKVVELSHIDL